MVEYTERQKEVLAEISKDNMWYQTFIYDDSLELYELIKNEPIERLKLIVSELVELANNDMWRRGLSKPEEQFDPTSMKLYETLNKQEHSVNSYSCTVKELTMVIEDYTKEDMTPKGLEGATIIASKEGVTIVREDCM